MKTSVVECDVEDAHIQVVLLVIEDVTHVGQVAVDSSFYFLVAFLFCGSSGSVHHVMSEHLVNELNRFALVTIQMQCS